MTTRTALVVGATGLTGRATAEHLAASGWTVYGLSRDPRPPAPGVRPIAADVLEPASIAASVEQARPTHLFYCTWLRRDTETANIEINRAMLGNTLDAAGALGTVEHVALVTGLKHYLGPFEAYAQNPARPPFQETHPRLGYPNFYYAQEDVLFAAAEKFDFRYSVHRPHTVIGYALGNAMNMGVTLAVYATIAAVTGRPFVFPGSPQQYEGTTDITDARLLARALAWAATAPSAANQAFNVVNGDTFRWREMWPVLAESLGVEPAPYPGHPTPLLEQMIDAEPTWRYTAERHGLAEPDVTRLASWWHTDSDLSRPVEAYADMTKSRQAGFHITQDSRRSFLDLFERLRRDRIIPEVTTR